MSDAIGIPSAEIARKRRSQLAEADFKRTRLNRWLYVDKTRFVR